MFDASPELEKLPYFAVGKAYDAPYELWERDVEIDEDAFYDYDEKHGQGREAPSARLIFSRDTGGPLAL